MMDMSRINRALGMIEGIAMGAKENAADMLLEAVELIDTELMKEERTGQAKINNGKKPPVFQVEHPEMDELTRALWQHHEDYGQGYTQDFGAVCSDCRKAADLIVELRQELERVMFEKYAEG